MGLLSKQKFGLIVTQHARWLNETQKSLTMFQKLSNLKENLKYVNLKTFFISVKSLRRFTNKKEDRTLDCP
jgi:hypothetical protein